LWICSISVRKLEGDVAQRKTGTYATVAVGRRSRAGAVGPHEENRIATEIANRDQQAQPVNVHGRKRAHRSGWVLDL
jgi:hypothetical protein